VVVQVLSSERFDLPGNSLAILSGIASSARANRMISWIEQETAAMRLKVDLGIDLTPNFSPFVKPGNPEWNERYTIFNNSGDYHNSGIWYFISGIYIAA